jgi:RNA polymerase sigma factor (sigma-70 family)
MARQIFFATFLNLNRISFVSDKQFHFLGRLNNEMVNHQELLDLSRVDSMPGEQDFVIFMQQNQESVYRLALYLLGNTEEAKDAAQESFVKAWKKFETFRSETGRAWIMKITVNLCLDWLRRRKFRNDFPESESEIQEDFEYRLPDPNPYPLEQCLSEEMQVCCYLAGSGGIGVPGDRGRAEYTNKQGEIEPFQRTAKTQGDLTSLFRGERVMRCEKVKESLEAYVEGELGKSEREELETHISNCESCKRELTLTQSIPRLISSLPKPPVPEDIIPDTLKRLREKSATKRRWLRAIGMISPRKWQFAVVGSLLISVLIFGISYQMTNRNSGITEAEVVSAAQDIKLALGIVETATQDIQLTVLAAGAEAYDEARSKSRDTIQTLSNVQVEAYDTLRRNLAFWNQL